eukprot:798336-Pelagomonas_calceolata.AAC.3
MAFSSMQPSNHTVWVAQMWGQYLNLIVQEYERSIVVIGCSQVNSAAPHFCRQQGQSSVHGRSNACSTCLPRKDVDPEEQWLGHPKTNKLATE